MDYKEFADRIAEMLQWKIGDGCTVTVTEILKNNGVSPTGVVIMKESDRVVPTIYLEEPYRQYKEGVSLSEIAEEIKTLYEKNSRNIKLDIDFFRDFSQVEGRIFHKVINQKMPELLLPMQKLLEEEEMTGIRTEESIMQLYVLTNRERMFGASAMLYSEKIKGLADKLHTDLLILPGSVHETLQLTQSVFPIMLLFICEGISL